MTVKVLATAYWSEDLALCASKYVIITVPFATTKTPILVLITCIEIFRILNHTTELCRRESNQYSTNDRYSLIAKERTIKSGKASFSR